MRTLALCGFLSFIALACASKYNTVRLSRDQKTNNAYLALVTEHYVSLDGDRVLELDRGERTITFEFRRPAAIGRPANDAIMVTIKLYDTDAPPHGRLRFEAGGVSGEFDIQNPKRELFSETVTVLDSGQRQVDNPNLANSAQAQTGYITFGKPTAAGAAQRSWHLYRFEITPESDVLTLVRSAKQAAVFISSGNLRAEAQISEKQLGAWRRYASGDYDDKVDP